jgi:hypothetical protein
LSRKIVSLPMVLAVGWCRISRMEIYDGERASEEAMMRSHCTSVVVDLGFVGVG